MYVRPADACVAQPFASRRRRIVRTVPSLSGWRPERAAILLLGRWLGKAFVHFGQPRVIGEMVAGIMLGPSLLGWISPEAMNFVLPREVGPYLGIIAQIGVILSL